MGVFEVEIVKKTMKTQKTALSFILMTVMAVTAHAQQYDSENDFEIRPINDGKAVAITKYVGPKQAVRIPPTIQKLPVAGIGSWAFYECTSLNSINIPNSVTSIGEQAFAESSLTSITIPNSINTIRNNTFDGCDNLTSVTIPNSVTTIGEHAFQACGSLTSINLPITLTTIEAFAFSECANLNSVTFQGPIPPSGIHEGVFDGLGDLRDKYIVGGPGIYKRPIRSIVWTKQ